MQENSKLERRDLKLRGEFVELNKVLKFENLVESGGAAKQAILEGLASVDGVVENRIRRKLVPGNVVRFGDVEIHVCKPE